MIKKKNRIVGCIVRGEERTEGIRSKRVVLIYHMNRFFVLFNVLVKYFDSLGCCIY